MMSHQMPRECYRCLDYYQEIYDYRVEESIKSQKLKQLQMPIGAAIIGLKKVILLQMPIGAAKELGTLSAAIIGLKKVILLQMP